MNNTTQICEISQYLANNYQLRIMLIIRAIMCVIGLALLAVVLRVQGTYLAFHSNARVLMFSHHIWTALQSISSFMSFMINLIRFAINNGDPCQYITTTAVAIAIRGPALFLMYGQIFSLASLAIERLLATIRYRDYESNDRTFGVCLIVLQVVD